MSRSRTRRIAKWTGVVVCALLFIVAVASFWLYFGYRWTPGTESYDLIAVFGSAKLRWMQDAPPNRGADGWLFSRHHSSEELVLLPTYLDDERFARIYGITMDWTPFADWTLPLWIPFLTITIPTAWLWWRDRRHPPGHCRKCGYDLTGNVTGVCSECGTKVEG